MEGQNDTVGTRIGVAVRDAHLPGRLQIMEGVRRYANEHPGVVPYLIPVRNNEAPSAEALAKVDGLVVWGAPGDQWVVDIWNSSKPLVNCNHAFEGLVPMVSSGKLHLMMMEFLLNLGREAIGYVVSSEVPSGCPLGIPKFVKYVEEHGKSPYVFDQVQLDPALHPEQILTAKGEAGLERYLKELPKPATLWCVHDEMAAMVWIKAAAMNIKVPEEIALVGFGNHPCSKNTVAGKGLTTIRGDFMSLGQEAARLLCNHLAGKGNLTSDLTVMIRSGARVLERESTGTAHRYSRGMQRAWLMLENYPKGGLTVDQLVAAAATSRGNFYLEFEKAYGIPPGKALRNARLRKAKEYLANPNLTMETIGSNCGFSGDGTFSNFIRRETGMTPTQLRRQLLGQATGQTPPEST